MGAFDKPKSRISIARFVIAWTLSSTLFGAAAAPSGDAAWIACTKAPTRACVFDEAFRIARTSTQFESSVWQVLALYADVDPIGALRLVPGAEVHRKTLRTEEDRAQLDDALVRVYAKARKFAEAERVLARLKGTSTLEYGAPARVVSAYDASALAFAAELARAQSVTAAVARLRALGVVPSTTYMSATAAGVFFNDVARFAVARGDDAALMAFAKEVSVAGVKRSEHENTVYGPLLAVAFAQLEAGKVQPALAVVAGIPLYTPRVSATGWFGSVLVDAGRVDEALEFASKIRSNAERQEALRSMLTRQGVNDPVFKHKPRAALAEPARTAAAMQLAARFAGAARNDAYALIARACAASGRIDEAWHAARKIRTALSSYYALTAIGAAEAKAGRPGASVATFAQARMRAPKDATGFLIESIVYLQLSLFQFEAVEAIMRDEAGKPNSKLKHKSAQYALMLAYAEAGRLDEAFGTPYDDLARELRRPLIAKALAKGGFTKRAVELVLTGADSQTRKDQALFDIVVDRAFSGALADAALALAPISPGTRQGALVTLAEAYAQYGYRAKTPPLIREALQFPLPPADAHDTVHGGFDLLLRAGGALPK